MEVPIRETGVDFIEEFALAAEWFADALLNASMRAPVPACPGWNVLDLVSHLGNVHSWAATIVETGHAAHDLADRPSSSRNKRVRSWYLAKAEDLYEVLRSAEPSAPCWNFAYGEGLTSFWPRRQTHETLMHRIDLAQSQPNRSPEDERLPAVLAADGIDEALTVFGRRLHQRGFVADLSGPIGLHAVDTGDSWTVRPGSDGAAPGVERGALPEDYVEGAAAELLLALWKRRPFEDLVVKGNTERVWGFLASRLTA